VRPKAAMSEYIHGPTDPDEVARLEHQAVFIASRALLGFAPRELEVDNASLRTVPEYAEVVMVMAALNQTQIAANAGDPFIGQRLNELLVTADFSHVEVGPLKIMGAADDPVHYRDFSRVFVDIFESVAGLLGPAMASMVLAAAERIRTLPDIPGSELHYTPVVASATRGE
jgi:hypothetical protein